MKRKLHPLRIILCAIALALAPYIATGQTTLTVVYSDALQTNYAIESSGKLYFSGTNLMVQTSLSASAQSLPVSSIRKLLFASTTSIEEVGTQTKFIVHPNPATDHIYFTLPEDTGASYAVRMFDLQGRQVLSGTYGAGEVINIATLNAGLYFMRLNNTETVKVLKK